MKIGLVGETYQEWSLPFNAERSINLFAVLDEQGKEVSAMYGTPGIYNFANAGTGSIRGVYSATNGRAFCVSGSQLFELSSAGVSTLRGTLNQSSGIVYLVENGLQLGICDGVNIYTFTYSTNAFLWVKGGVEYVTNGTMASDTAWTKGAGWTISGGVADAAGAISTALSQNAAATVVSGRSYVLTYTVTRSAGSITPSIGGTSGVSRAASGTYTETIVGGATQVLAFTGSGFTGTIDNIVIHDTAYGLPASVGTIAFLDSYFIVNQNDTGKFFISDVNNGNSWDPLDFASAESSPDKLKRVIQAVGQLWLQGDDSTEIWTNTGASSFPFQRISGAKMTVGILAPATSIEVDNSLMWVGSTREGSGIVYRAQGFTPVRISTTPIELLIAKATDKVNMRSFTYQQDGHLFYIITGGGLETSLVYDLTTKLWHERAYMDAEGNFETHLAACCMKAFDKILVGDKNVGNIYVLDQNTYSDNGSPMASERIYTHLGDEDKELRYNRLVIFLENGIGLQSGQGSDPVIDLQLSKDGARTWSDIFTASMGKVGEYKTKVVFRRLGVAEQMTFKIRITDPVKRVLIGSYLT